jgi:hypothetical protein
LPYHRDKYRDGTVQASGPFIRDKLWFFGSLQYQRDWDSQPGVDPSTPTENDSRRMFYKFNYAINDHHRIMHGYHHDFYFIPDVATSFQAPSTIGFSHGDNPTPNLVYTGVLSDKTFIEGRYSGFFLHSSNNPQQADSGAGRLGLPARHLSCGGRAHRRRVPRVWICSRNSGRPAASQPARRQFHRGEYEWIRGSMPRAEA